MRDDALHAEGQDWGSDCCVDAPFPAVGKWAAFCCSRRSFLGWGAAFGAAAALGSASAQNVAASRFPVADVHSHMGLFGPTRSSTFSPDRFMAAGHVKLVAWKWVPDLKLVRRGSDGRLLPASSPNVEELWAFTESGLKDMRDSATLAQLTVVRQKSDIDSAEAGQAAVVLASEGCDFADDGLSRIDAVHAMGVRHLQLVHYTPNPFADIQSRPILHNGITAKGLELIARCNRLGILVDVAHMTPSAAMVAAERSERPVIWSHSALRAGMNIAGPTDRLLPLETAKAIAARGGVVGLWGFNATARHSLSGYVQLVRETIDLLGEDHVAFGTDLSGLSNWAIIHHYGDLAEVMDRLVQAGLQESTLRKLAFDNYARVLKAALST